MDNEELDWGEEEHHQGTDGAPDAAQEEEEEALDLRGPADALAAQEEPLQREGSMTPPASPASQGANGNGAAPAPAAAAAASSEPTQEEWQAMHVPDEWRPRPMVRVWGLPAASTEEELAELLQAQLEGTGHAVRSVTFDARQATAAGKVALVRFQPPPQPEGGVPEPDVGKVAEGIIAKLRAAAPVLHGAKVNVEKTGAEVCLFLTNLPAEAQSDEGLREACSAHGALERCFVMRNPSGGSKGYAFAEFTLPGSAAACKEAWNKAGEAQRLQGGLSSQRVKLQRAEPAPIKTVSGLFGATIYVVGLQQSFLSSDRLQQLFSAHGVVKNVYLPRHLINANQSRGFAFVHFKHSFGADAAYHALDGTEHEGIGKLLLSFANPVKAVETQNRPSSAAGAQRTAPQLRTSQPLSQQTQQVQRGVGAASTDRGARTAGYQAGSGYQSGAATGRVHPAGAPVGGGGMMPGSIILPRGMPPPPPGNPPPAAVAAAALHQRQHQQAALAMGQQQQAAALQQMMMMQQAAAMQQAMMQQAAAAAELQRKQQEEAERAKAEAERKRKEDEDKEKARREQEYAQRLGYGAYAGLPGAAGGMAGMAGLTGLQGMASFMTPAAMAAMASAAGMAGLPMMAGLTGGLGGMAGGAGGAGATTGTAGGARAAAGAEQEPSGRGRSGADAGYGGSGSPYRAAGGAGTATGGGSQRDRGGAGYSGGGSGRGEDDGYEGGGRQSERSGYGGGSRRGETTGYGNDSYYDSYGAEQDDYGYGGGSGRGGRSYEGEEYGGDEYGGRGGSGYGGGSGYAAEGRSGYGSGRAGQGSGRSGYADRSGGGGSGYGGGKRDTGYQNGGGYGERDPPKRPRY